MAFNEWLFARFYPPLIEFAERGGQRERRAELFGRAEGRTLEIGAGAGHNLPHLTSAVTQLVVSEPSPHMLAHLRTRLAEDPPPVGSWELVRTGAEQLPFDDASFDTVTASFVHCTIPDPAAALRELARVLRPGGRYLFLEHVRSSSPVLGRVQDVLELPHVYVAAGCHPNRRFEELVARSPLRLVEAVHAPMPRSPLTVRPTVRGVAVAPG